MAAVFLGLTDEPLAANRRFRYAAQAQTEETMKALFAVVLSVSLLAATAADAAWHRHARNVCHWQYHHHVCHMTHFW